jgi:hypothetical protein
VDFFNTHAHARYGDPGYNPVRLSNMREMAAFVNAATTGTSPAFVVGDLNARPQEEQYKTLVNDARLKRLMNVDSRVDHIFAVENPGYRFEVLDTQPIEKEISVGGESVRISNHSGYLSTIRITPR